MGWGPIRECQTFCYALWLPSLISGPYSLHTGLDPSCSNFFPHYNADQVSSPFIILPQRPTSQECQFLSPTHFHKPAQRQKLVVATEINFLWKQQVSGEEKLGKEVLLQAMYQLQDDAAANNKTSESPKLITLCKYKASKGFLELFQLGNAFQKVNKQIVLNSSLFLKNVSVTLVVSYWDLSERTYCIY